MNKALEHSGVKENGSVSEMPLSAFLEKCAVSPLLSILDVDIQKHLFKTSPPRYYEPNHVLISEGTIGRSLFVLLSGRVGAYFNDAYGNPRFVSKYRDGDFFGEGSRFTDGVRNASLHTTVPSVVLELDAETVERLTKEVPPLHDLLFKTWEERKNALQAMRKEYAVNVRKHPRVKVGGEALFRIHKEGEEDESEFGVIKNLSIDGCKIEMDGHHFLRHVNGLSGREVPLKLNPDGIETPLRAKGRVLWYSQAEGLDVFGYYYRIGFLFTRLPDEDYRRLVAYLRTVEEN